MCVSLLLPIVFFTSISSAQLKPCYSGGSLTDQIPCDPSANVSACCAPGGICVTNFYCHGAAVGDQFDRVGGCTDKSGNDLACPFPFLRGTFSSCHIFAFVENEFVFAYGMAK